MNADGVIALLMVEREIDGDWSLSPVDCIRIVKSG